MSAIYRNIILIDDDAINNLLNRQFLTFVLPGANITTFQDARLVLRYLEEGKIARPDLILLDINMPEMNGWEFLFFLEELEHKADVMMLSSSIHLEDIDKSKLYNRVKCYIEKPLTEEKISRYIVEQDFSQIELD